MIIRVEIPICECCKVSYGPLGQVKEPVEALYYLHDFLLHHRITLATRFENSPLTELGQGNSFAPDFLVDASRVPLVTGLSSRKRAACNKLS